VVRLIDGRSTAAEISAEAPAEPFAVEKLLAALVTLGLIHPEFAAAEDRAVLPAPTPEAEEVSPWEPGQPRLPEEPEEQGSAEAEPDEEEGEPPTSETPEEPPVNIGEIPVAESDQETEPVREDFPKDVEYVSIEMPAEAEREDFRSDGAGTDFDAEGAMAGDLAGGDLRDREAGSPLDRALDLTTGIGAEQRPRHRSTSPLLWLLALLAAGVGTTLVLRGRSAPPPSEPAVALSTLSPTPFASEPTASFPAAALATPAAAIATPAPSTPPATKAAAPATGVPTAAPSRPTAAATPPAPAPREAGAGGDSKSRQYWVDRAARDRKRAGADRKARFTIQLELACEVESLVDAWKHDRPAGTMWVLATPFGGRTCFRVLWGRYATREAGARGGSRVLLDAPQPAPRRPDALRGRFLLPYGIKLTST
jgi:hypothetical protein